MSRRETNPHFSRPLQPQVGDQQQPPIPTVPHEDYRGRPTLPVAAPVPTVPHEHYRPRGRPTIPVAAPIPTVPHQNYRGQPPFPGPAPIQEDASHQHNPRFSLPPHHEDHVPLRADHDSRFPFHLEQEGHHQPPSLQAPRKGSRSSQPPRGGSRKKHRDHDLRPGKSRVNFQEPSVIPPPLDHPPEPRRQLAPHHERRHGGIIRFPKEHKSPPLTWMGACLCVIFWLVIIIGALIVLIVYLVFRPQIPHFDVSSVTLNAAYLDVGYLLNADLTMLTNFTNPNKKVHVDFSSVIIYLYYGNTLIATQYVEPFSAARVQSRFAYIHMVTSQVQLPLNEAQRLVKQMESNGVWLDVKGVFRARSKLGAILRYSYNLYGRCSIMVARPPEGIMMKRKCRTKR
ncbi:NDR1/HIN1-like protein 6 [Trifolium pratense]|uniref:NDR1/HIN1-like protein 6 n=1 Tax=Trifolium pratense TaxID=57577 RepID=UPI001E693E7D|nr:NDR1/HIN1-like protein 6 [Trifolium pratense]